MPSRVIAPAGLHKHPGGSSNNSSTTASPAAPSGETPREYGVESEERHRSTKHILDNADNPEGGKESQAELKADDLAATPRHRILFYRRAKPHYGFTNFSAHPVWYNGKRYPTSEHLFQSFKFQGNRPDLAELIRTCGERPSAAFNAARKYQPQVRSDWFKVNVEKMDETIYHKFTQHKDLKKELLDTGDAELVEVSEDSDKDSFWGIGPDGQGRNELGKALERLRTRLRGD
ncbi:DUF1768-domain-containing protein [Gymnopus androsaceus JB14]|uniref:DUF1768-domain-containing protein n=1 Tax=Gymnopus androsaceus JB14 TaxID=1447944 RepID=A0A6A4HNL6_9AGAR|nr:DUF1768-domain-containing protein [Gymnopus androsaceus JB14]